MTDVQAQPEPVTKPKPKWFLRKWVQIVAAFFIGAIVGTSGSSSGPSEADLAAANERAKTAEQAASTAQQEAATAKTDAEAALAADRAKIEQAQKDLDAREKKVSGLEAAAKANEFDGSDGKYLVGVDIKPGTYRGTPSSGCYYARLSSLDDNDIIENNNTDGPVLVRIRSTDKAFQVKRCGTFTRIGD